MSVLPDERQRLDQVFPVTDPAWQSLQAYAAHLEHWQKTLNLVAPSTLPCLWDRHVLDCWQLLPLIGSDRQSGLVDLGSGAGLPGMVLAIAGAAGVHLIESNHRKAAFLRFVAEQTGAACHIHAMRAEAVSPHEIGPVSVVTARALTALPALLGLCQRFCGPSTRLLLPKGARWEDEVRMAEARFTFGMTVHESVTDRQAVILELRSLAER